MKNGHGKFLYLDRGQVYTGTWVDDIPKCGTLEDTNRDAPNPPPYPIPQVYTHIAAVIGFCVVFTHIPSLSLQCTLVDMNTVLQDAKEALTD